MEIILDNGKATSVKGFMSISHRALLVKLKRKFDINLIHLYLKELEAQRKTLTNSVVISTRL